MFGFTSLPLILGGSKYMRSSDTYTCQSNAVYVLLELCVLTLRDEKKAFDFYMLLYVHNVYSETACTLPSPLNSLE